MLYIVPTPIGNLQDITLRAIDTLKKVECILCEDTRHSSVLLNYYQIQKPLMSYHKFNESERSEHIIEELKKGRSFALITDAGTPCIADPGHHLIEECYRNHITVVPLPGPCAAITALSASGLPTERFQFVGFLPKKEMELKKAIVNLLMYEGVSICYESPHRVVDTLQLFAQHAPSHMVTVARELTKVHEEIKCLSAMDQWNYWSSKESIKGEFVLLVSGSGSTDSHEWESMSPKEHIAQLEEVYGITRKEAIKLAAQMRGVSKRDIYQQTL